MMRVLGVDLSEYQRGISFDRLMADGAQFAILRGGDGGYNDKCFVPFYDECKKRNLPVGAYWFSRALNANQAEAEAEQFFRTCLNGRQFELPVYMDIECSKQQALSKQALTDVVTVWCNTIRKHGFMVGVYTTANWLNNEVHLSALGDVELWIAQWSRTEPSIPHGMWQFGGDGANYYRGQYMAGFLMDQNFMSVDYPSIIKAAGLNGFEKEDDEVRYNTIADLKADEAAKKYYLPTIEKMMAKGFLNGKGGSGDSTVIDLGEDAIRVMVTLDRAGVYGE